MKINYLNKFFCFFLLLCGSFSFAQVTNTISDLRIGNNTVTQINFEANSSVTVTFKVKLQTFNGDFNNVMGNLYIYTKNSPTAVEIQREFHAIVFTPSYPPFVPQATYNSEMDFTISLPASGFSDTGGVLYAEYKNNNGQKYKSSNINIVKAIISNPEPDPIPNFDIQSIKYAERGYSVEGGQVLVHKDQSNVSLNISYTWQKFGGSMCSDKVTYVRYNISGTGGVNILNEGTIMQFPSSPCTATNSTIKGILNTFSIPKSQIDNKQFMRIYYTPKNTSYGYRGTFEAFLSFRIVDFTDTNIFAILSGRGDNAFVTSLSGKAVKINLSETIGANYTTINASQEDVNIYEWYKRPINGTWVLTTVPNYELLKTITVTTEFFRRSIYKGIYEDSNILTFEPYPPTTPILPVIELDNTICCDQTVAVSVQPSAIVGNIPNSSISYTYRWQSSGDTVSWNDIISDNSFSKDYTPDRFYSQRAAKTRYYRRSVITPQGISYSNYVKMQNGATSARATTEANYNFNDIQLYPSPTSDILNIESVDDLSAFTISVYDSYGNKKNISAPVYNGGKIHLYTTALPQGLYLLVLEDAEQMITKQFIKN